MTCYKITENNEGEIVKESKEIEINGKCDGKMFDMKNIHSCNK
jgi:hypothetical protein